MKEKGEPPPSGGKVGKQKKEDGKVIQRGEPFTGRKKNVREKRLAVWKKGR